ncbi:MAG: phosphonate metabolism transcriptional regulator PhnF, partial [Rhabdaerophilum calidifontis]
TLPPRPPGHPALPEQDAARRDGSGGQAIAREIEARIRSGALATGMLLPSAPELAAQYQVNRHTVRRAFQHLAEIGLVSVTRGRGTEVVAPRIPYRIGRRVSLRSNVGEAGLAVSVQLLDTEPGEARAAVREALGLRRGAPVWQLRTLSLANGVPFSYARHTVSRERFPDFPRALRDAGVSISGALTALGIVDYLRLSTRLSARGATPEEAERLALARGAAVMQSIGRDGLPDGTPIHLAETVFAGARMEMVVEAGPAD